MRRLFVALLLLLSVAMLGFTSSANVEEGNSMGITVSSVSCENKDGRTIVSILLQLPNPGYKLASKNITVMDSTLIVELKFNRSSGPVIQVITMKGLTLTINESIERIKIIINGTKLYDATCDNTTTTPNTQQEPVNTAPENTDNANQTAQRDQATHQDLTTAKEQNTTIKLGLAGIGTILALIGILLIRK